MPELVFLEETHEYLVDGVKLPSVTQVLTSEGFIDTRWYTSEASIRGTYVHKACHLYDLGTLDEGSLDEVLKPYLEAYKLFKFHSGFTVIETEVRKFNKDYGFAGTPDKKGTFGKESARLDIKSGNAEPWVKLQLGAYHLLDCDVLCRNYILQLRGDGTYSLSERIKDIRQCGDIFLAALACFRWKQNNRR